MTSVDNPVNDPVHQAPQGVPPATPPATPPVTPPATPDPPAPLTQVDVDRAITTATTGLNTKNTELLAEKKATQAKLDGLLESLGGDDGVKALVDMRKKLANDELGSLLADGKHDEWFDKRTGALRDEHTRVLDAKEKSLTDALAERDTAIEKLHVKMLEVNIGTAATTAGVLDEPGIRQDVMLNADNDFTYDTELDRSVIRDAAGSVVYGKDPKVPLGFDEWFEQKKESHRHWWAPSKGGGAGGSGGEPIPDRELTEIPMIEYIEKRKKQGVQNF